VAVADAVAVAVFVVYFQHHSHAGTASMS
jgi:hypothetical protein